jgi:hypothetical protein
MYPFNQGLGNGKAAKNADLIKQLERLLSELRDD